MLCSCMWWVCGLLFKTLRELLKNRFGFLAVRGIEKGEDMQAMGTKHLYQRELLQLDRSMCCCYIIPRSKSAIISSQDF